MPILFRTSITGMIQMAKRQLKLGAFMRPVSIHTGAWRYPGAVPDANFNFPLMKQMIRKLEAGKFDAFFMADHLAVLNMPVEALKRSHTVTSFEPFTLLSALAAVTENIGLVATGSTTFDAPIMWRVALLRWITFPAVGPAGISSRHRIPTPHSISASTTTWSMRSATSEHASSTMW